MAFPLFAQGAFAASPNDTPETIARKREMIAAMMPRFGSARYVGEGLGQLATGIVVGRKNRQLDAAEGVGRKSAADQFARLFGTANSAQSPDVQGPLSVLGMGPEITPVDPSNPEAIASDAMTALGKGTTAEGIKAGLVARGMPEHIADGFVMNFQDESGLNPGINERNPIVPGSRGGFGLAQWTGPRRKALEAFAAERGMPVSDPGVQMDFLMTELQGPEASAWSKISAATTPGEAGAAIVNNFLRPAEEHRRAREAEYLGGAGMPASGAAPAPTSAPAIPINELYMALQNPWMSAEEKGLITSMIQEQQQASDPLRQLELRKAELELAQLENPNQTPEEVTGRMLTLDSLGIDKNSPEGQAYILTGKWTGPGGEESTSYGTTLQFFTGKDGKLRAGVIGNDGTMKEVPPPDGGDWAAGVDKVDAGTKWIFYDKRTGQMVGEEPKDLRGAESEKALGQAEGEAAGEAVTGLGNALAKGEQALSLIDQIAADPALPSILGIVQGNIAPGTPIIGGGQAGADLGAKIEQLQGQVFLEAFESLKGAGQITEIEGQKAEKAKARLQRTQSPEAYRAALAELRAVIEGGMKRAQEKAGKAGGSASVAGGKRTLKWNPATESFE